MGTAADRPDETTIAGRNLNRLHEAQAQGIDTKKQTWVLEVSPTLTHKRHYGFWITSRQRRMSPAEQFRLQGFPVNEIYALPSGQLAGNAMTVPVVTHILNHSLLPHLVR